MEQTFITKCRTWLLFFGKATTLLFLPTIIVVITNTINVQKNAALVVPITSLNTAFYVNLN